MKTTTLVVTALLAIGLALPTMAQPPGNYSVTFEYVTASYFDFKDGVGIADPADQNSPCTTLLLGLRGIQPLAETWEVDQNMGTNLNGPGVGVSNLRPPLAAPGGWLPNSGGVNLGIPCPLPGSGTTSLWLIWSGVNWRSAQADSSTQLTLCSQETFASSSPGCLAVPDANMHLYASACNLASVSFAHDYTDSKGKYLAGLPFDTLALKNDAINSCTVRHSHDYTDTIQDFTAGSASQTFDIIKNEAVVHAGSGSAYMAVCWQVTYLDFQDPLAPTTNTARTHDWKLILDVYDPGAPASVIAALLLHYGGQQTGDSNVGASGATVAMRGFYSDDATGAGQNGPGPCTAGGLAEAKKPEAIDNPTPTQAQRCVWDGATAANCDGNANACVVAGTGRLCSGGTCIPGRTVAVNNAIARCGTQVVAQSAGPNATVFGTKTVGAYSCEIKAGGGFCFKP